MEYRLEGNCGEERNEREINDKKPRVEGRYPFIKKQIRVLVVGADGVKGVVRASSEEMNIFGIEPRSRVDGRASE